MEEHRLDRLAKKFGLNNYLEIGVYKGATFNRVNTREKHAVDPKFMFNYKDYASDNVHFHEMKSDDFFNKLKKEPSKREFDLIYLDGLHTFEQTYKDFLQTQNYSNKSTIWVFDDILPKDPFTAIPDQRKAGYYKTLYKFKYAGDWMGDVFKIIFALRFLHEDFSYVTIFHPVKIQTVAWKNKIPVLRKFSGISNPDLSDIQKLTFFDMMDNLKFYNFIHENDIENHIYNNIDILEDQDAIINQYLSELDIRNC